MGLGVWKKRIDSKNGQKDPNEIKKDVEEDGDETSASAAGSIQMQQQNKVGSNGNANDDPSAIYRNLLTGRHFRKRRYQSKEAFLNDVEIRREVLGGADDDDDDANGAGWKRPCWLGLGLLLVLCPFWMLDSLKDPIFAGLVEGNFERHQPTAKLCSVTVTLLLVCAIEMFAERRKQARDGKGDGDCNSKHREGSTDGENTEYRRRRTRKLMRQNLPRWEQRSEQQSPPKSSVLTEEDPISGEHWSRMDVQSSSERNIDRCDHESQSAATPLSAFKSIGISYVLLFLFHMNLLWQFESFNLSTPQEGTKKNAFKSSYFLAYLLYASIESFGSLAVAAFWSFCNSTLSLRQAERYYGTIVALAQLGAILGSTLVATSKWNAPTLVLVACLFILLHVLVMQTYVNRFHPVPRSAWEYVRGVGNTPEKESDSHGQSCSFDSDEQENKREKLKTGTAVDSQPHVSPTAWLGIRLIFRHNYVLLILGVSCLYEVSLTCLDYQMKLLGYDRFEGEAVVEAVTAYFDGSNSAVPSPKTPSELEPASFSQFMGRYGQAVNAISLVLSALVFPFLIHTIGLRWTLRLFPTLLLFVTVVAFGALPGNLIFLVASLSLLKAMTYSIHDPAKELLYLPTSAAIQFRAKFWIDVVGARVSKAVGSAINTYAGSADRVVRVGTVPSLVTAGALWCACFSVGRQFDQLRETGTIVGEDDKNGNNEGNHLPYEPLPAAGDDLNDADAASQGSHSGKECDSPPFDIITAGSRPLPVFE